jgi:hypothetical protein
MRELPEPGFTRDDGAVDPRVSLALQEYGQSRNPAPVLAALCGARLLVPVVAVAREVDAGAGGQVRDKSADIAAVLMQGRDGRRALLAFTSLDTLQAWDTGARPVPVSAADAARAAVAENASALLVDVAGPVRFVVETSDLRELAEGHVLCRTSAGYAWLAAG